MKLGLKGKEKRNPSQLSGGEQQRVAIAVALANDPRLLLADEPTGELDSTTTAMIIDYFKELNEELGITVCVATHDRRFSKMTDFTYKIQDGRLTSFQFQTEGTDKKDQRDEVVIVDSHGNLRLPANILAKYQGLSSVKIISKPNKIELIPYDQDES